MRRTIYIFPAILILALLCIVSAAPAEEPAPKKLVLSVHPYLSSAEIVERFTPLAEYLSRKLERPVKIRVSRDYQEHIEFLGNGGDAVLSFMGPASYVKAMKHYGKTIRPLAVIEINGKGSFRGAIVKRVGNEDIKSLEDLSGKLFAFGDPSSTMSHLVPLYMLMEAGVTLRAKEHLGSHDNVALGVLSGAFDAGAVKEEVYENYRSRGLALLAYTPEISEHVFVAGKFMPKDEAVAIAGALIGLASAEEGPEIMGSMKKDLNSMRHPLDSDYRTLQRILDRLQGAEMVR